MLKKFKVTSHAFILCLFGLAFFKVSPVLAEDSAAFVECQKIKPNGMSYDLMKEKKNCFRDLARALNDNLLTHSPAAPIIEPHGTPLGELEKQLSDAREVHRISVERYEQSDRALRADLAAANAAQEPLNTRIAELEKQLSDAREVHRISVERYEQSDRALRADLAAANAAQEPLNRRIANLERQLSGVSVGNTPHEPINPGSVDSENQITTGTPLSGGEIENNAPLRGDENDTNAAHELWAQEHGGRTISAGYEEVGIELHFIREPTRSQPNRLKLYVSLEYPNSNMEHCLSYGTGDCHLIEIIAGVHQRLIDHIRGSIDRRREEVASCEARGPGYKVALRNELYGRGNYVLQVPFDTGPGQQGTYNVREVGSCNR